MSRGYRNNNPGNLIKTDVKYLGEVESSDSRFRAFESMEYGYRAIFKLLQYYIGNGLNTITLMIDTYAPAHENDTTAYIRFVADRVGIRPDQAIVKSDLVTLEKMVAAISRIENGVEPDLKQVEGGKRLLQGLPLLVAGASGIGIVLIAFLAYVFTR